MEKKLLGVLVMALVGGCGQPTGTARSGALTAGEEARAFGVHAYLIEADAVALLGQDGRELGWLRTSAPTAETRTVVIDFADGSEYIDEISRPTADGGFVATTNAERGGSIERDRALVGYFAQYGIQYLEPPTAPANALAPEDYARCADIPWTTGCSLYQCGTYSESAGAYHHTANNPDLCGLYTPCGYAGPPNLSYCCYWNTSMWAYGQCTPNGHGCTNADIVKKTRSCVQPGSCTNQADGFQFCI